MCVSFLGGAGLFLLLHHHLLLSLLLMFILLLLSLLSLLLFPRFSTLQPPFSFVACSCLSCTPSFCLLLFFLSVLFSFFSTSSFTALFFSPCFIVEVWYFSCSASSFFTIFFWTVFFLFLLFYFFFFLLTLVVCNLGAPRPKNGDGLKTYKNSGFGQRHCESRSAENSPSKSVRPFCNSRQGWCAKRQKPSKTLRFRGRQPQNTQFSKDRRDATKKKC